MSRQINQPINQVRLTNVAVVRMNRGGKRFEIACYRNKVVDYRQGLETDLSEVLQTERVFTNVSKGEFSKAKDLQKVFGTKDEEEIARLILSTGQVQVSDKERSQQLEKTNAQIAEWISKNCVQPGTDRPYTISQIRHAMQQGNFSVHPNKPLKRQYLDCVKVLQRVIPIHRAKMELLLLIPDSIDFTCRIESSLEENNISCSAVNTSSGVDKAEAGSIRQYRILVDPSLYRILNDIVQTIEGAQIEILAQVVTKTGDVHLETKVGDSLKVGLTAEEDNLKTSGDDAFLEPKSDSLGESAADGSGNFISLDDTDWDVGTMQPNSRKQQKKNKKKKGKSQRREASGMGTTREMDVVVSLATNQESINKPFALAPNHSMISPTLNENTNNSRKSCNTCGGNFETPALFRSHFKSDWHKFNQKLKLKGVAPISEQEFLLCDSESFFGAPGDELM